MAAAAGPLGFGGAGGLHWPFLLVCVRKLDKPWKKSAGAALFPQGVEGLGMVEKLARPWQVVGAVSDEAALKALQKKMGVREWVQIGLWYGALGFSGIMLVMTAGWKWWYPLTRMEGARPGGEGWRQGLRAGRGSRACLAVALLVAALSRFPLLDNAMLWDEQDNLRHSYHGYEDVVAPGAKPKWHAATLRDAAWENARGNNPHLMSVAGQLSNMVWRAATGAPREVFSPVALRLPVAVAAVAGIAGLWWMMNVMGWGRAAPVAALLAAVHPMHAEYTIEARGYGFVLLFAPLALGAMVIAWRRMAWKDFWLFGVCLALCIWSFTGALYFAAVLGLTAAGGLAWRWLGRGDMAARAGFFRLAVCGVVLAGLLLWMMAPSIPQMALYMEHSFQKGHMPSWWYLNAWLMYSTGLLFFFPYDYYLMPAGTSPSAVAWMAGPFWQLAPGLALWGLVVMPGLALLGLAGMWRRAERWPLVLCLATLAAMPLCWMHHALGTGNYIYGWYTIYTLPVLLCLMAAGWETAAGWIEARLRNGRPLAWAMAAALPVVLALLTHPALGPGKMAMGGTKVARRPGELPWDKDSPGEIGREEMLRGHGLWVVYEDGRHLLFHDPDKAGDTLASMVQRQRNEPDSRGGQE